MIPYLIWALIPKRYLITAGAAIAALLVAVAALKIDRAHQRTVYFNKGYAVAHDSAQMAEIAERRDSAVAHAQALHDSASRYTHLLDSVSSKLAAAPRYQPRIEALVLPDSLSRIPDPVGVSVASTGEHFVLPRRAAEMWFTTDSLLGEALRANQKYVAANRTWASAWQQEHDARIASDSLTALWRERALNAVAPPKQSHAKRAVMLAALGAAVALIARNQIHR